MAESSPQPGGGSNIEQEIAQIEQQLAEKRAAFERQKKTGQIAEVPHEKETLREVVREQYVPPAPVSQLPTTNYQLPTNQPPPHVDSPSYLSDELKTQVQQLVNTAFTTSLADAVKLARATNNAALIDAFHDALVDELYNYLVERGKIQKL